MKQRKRKHLIMSRMANPPWDHDNPKMWFTHKIKPCRVVGDFMVPKIQLRVRRLQRSSVQTFVWEIPIQHRRV